MKFEDFLKEIIKGKNIGRALLFTSLKDLFGRELWLGGDFSVLELGHISASHQRAYPENWKIKISDYRPSDNLDYIVDINKKFPFKSEFFDGVSFFNVFYLADDYINCLTESLRVSRRFVIFNSPLISGIAKHPTDLNRFTEDKLKDLLEKLKNEQILKEYKIIPLGGSFSSAVNLIDVYLRYRIIKIPFYLAAILLDKLDKMIKRNCPMQYLVLIKK